MVLGLLYAYLYARKIHFRARVVFMCPVWFLDDPGLTATTEQVKARDGDETIIKETSASAPSSTADRDARAAARAAAKEARLASAN